MAEVEGIPVLVEVKRPMRWGSAYMAIFGCSQNDLYWDLSTHQRRACQSYCLYMKFHILSVMYHQHSYSYSLIRDPQRMRFWLRILSPITPLFGGLTILENNLRYTLFANMIAIGRGLFWTVPVMMWGRHWLNTNPDGEKVARYLWEGSWSVGHWLLPAKFKPAGFKNAKKTMYEYYVRRGLPVPEDYLSKEERAVVLARRKHETMYEYHQLSDSDIREQYNTDKGRNEYPEVKRIRATFNPQVAMAKETTTSIPGLARGHTSRGQRSQKSKDEKL